MIILDGMNIHKLFKKLECMNKSEFGFCFSLGNARRHFIKEGENVTGLQFLITMQIFVFKHVNFQKLTHLFTYSFFHKFIHSGLLHYVRMTFVWCHVIIFWTVLGELGKLNIFRSYQSDKSQTSIYAIA